MPNEKKKMPHAVAVFANPRALCLAALLAAMSLILGKFLQIPTPISTVVRISFENLPLILAGMMLGPIAGAMTGVVADLVGCALYGYAINPVVTLGAACVGAVAGLVAMIARRAPLLARVPICVVSAHAIGSVCVKTPGLAAWYLAQQNIGLGELFLWRGLNYTIIAVLESVLLYLLLRNRAISGQLERMCRK